MKTLIKYLRQAHLRYSRSSLSNPYSYLHRIKPWLVGSTVITTTFSYSITTLAGTFPSTTGLSFQTSGPSRAATVGDWYTTSGSNSTDRRHRFVINVPSSALTNGSVTITINDAESTAGAGSIVDEVLGTSDPTRFELRAADGTTVLQSQTVSSGSQHGTKVNFTVTQPGNYQVTSVTGAGPISGNTIADLNDDDNGFSITAPDGVLIGALQSTAQQDTGSTITAQPFYFLVGPGTSSLYLRNFDLDNGGSLTYIRPSGTTIAGTASGNGVWNGSSGSLNAGGDTVSLAANNADAGLWTYRINNWTTSNQTAFEANTGTTSTLSNRIALFDTAPTTAGNFTITPNTTLTTTTGVAVNHTFTVANNFFTNDIINLIPTGTSANYTVQLLDSAGNALTDTDGNGNLDTGILTPGQSKDFILRVTPNTGATTSDTTRISAVSYMDNKVGTTNTTLFVDKTTTLLSFNVSGTLYKDNNANNTFDSGTDSTLPANITVTLYNDANNNNQIDTGEQVGLPVTTNASGNYTFTNVFNGTYKIKVDTADTDIPSGFVIATSNDLPVTVNSANITGQNFGFVSLPSSFGSCSASPYISYDSPNKLGALNTNTLSLDTVGISPTLSYNAIGYNITNNLIYGILRPASGTTTNGNNLIAIGSDGVPTNLGAVSNLPAINFYNSGDVAANNIYYVVNGLVATKTFYRIDINPTSPTYKQMIGQFNLSNYNTTGFSFGDIAFNPVDGQIYAVLNILTSGNITSQQLIKINPSNGTTSTVGTASPTTTDLDSFIGLFVDRTGNIYGYQGNAGKLWRYSSTTGTRVLVKEGLPTASDNADGARCYDSPAISSLSERPQVFLVKRITAINSTAINTVVDDPNDPNDTNTNWPSNYLKGAISQNSIKPGDVVEYTIYFLSTGGSDASNARLCDLVPANTTFSADAFASGRGIKSSLGTTTTDLTNANDADKGRFYASTETAPTGCRVGQTITNGNGTTTLTNAKGAVVVDIGTISRATAPGTANSYGFVKFQVKVD